MTNGNFRGKLIRIIPDEPIPIWIDFHVEREIDFSMSKQSGVSNRGDVPSNEIGVAGSLDRKVVKIPDRKESVY